MQNTVGSTSPAEHVLVGLLDRYHRIRGMGAQHAVNFCHPTNTMPAPGFPQPLAPGLAPL